MKANVKKCKVGQVMFKRECLEGMIEEIELIARENELELEAYPYPWWVSSHSQS